MAEDSCQRKPSCWGWRNLPVELQEVICLRTVGWMSQLEFEKNDCARRCGQPVRGYRLGALPARATHCHPRDAKKGKQETVNLGMALHYTPQDGAQQFAHFETASSAWRTWIVVRDQTRHCGCRCASVTRWRVADCQPTSSAKRVEVKFW